jgi:hypothetical protein
MILQKHVKNDPKGLIHIKILIAKPVSYNIDTLKSSLGFNIGEKIVKNNLILG